MSETQLNILVFRYKTVAVEEGLEKYFHVTFPWLRLASQISQRVLKSIIVQTDLRLCRPGEGILK